VPAPAGRQFSNDYNRTVVGGNESRRLTGNAVLNNPAKWRGRDLQSPERFDHRSICVTSLSPIPERGLIPAKKVGVIYLAICHT
jgi:hypothetical protein